MSQDIYHREAIKILRTPPPPISSSKEIFPASLVAPLPNSEQINHPFSNHTYTKSTTNYIHHHYVPFLTLSHNISSSAPTYAPPYCQNICGQTPPDVTALLARWAEKLVGGPQSGRSATTTRLARVKGVGRQQQQ